MATCLSESAKNGCQQNAIDQRRQCDEWTGIGIDVHMVGLVFSHRRLAVEDKNAA